MKKKPSIVFILVIVIGGFVIFYQCFLSNYLLQSNFALKTPIQTVQGDKFNYTFATDQYLAHKSIEYEIYHYEGNKWNAIMECGGEHAGIQDITINSIYQNNNIIVYKVLPCIGAGIDTDYILVDKANGKGTDLSSELENAYYDMTKEQIQKDEILNKAKEFILNYSMPQKDHYKDMIDKVKQIFQEK